MSGTSSNVEVWRVCSFKPIVHRGSTASESSLAGLFSSTGGDSTPTGRQPHELHTVTESSTLIAQSSNTAVAGL